MAIDLVLVGLQTVFLSLYGTNGVVESIRHKKISCVSVLITFLGIALLCIFLESYIRYNLQLLVFLLLILDYMLHLYAPDSGRLGKTVVFAGITFMAYAHLYFWLELPIIGLAAPFFYVALLGMMNKWPKFLVDLKEYFLKAGALLTLLFMVEPVALSSIQQNLKPIATIPIAQIINRQNFWLLGALVVLMLGGFFWKEKSRL
ncbi:hypothetical protein [Ulvibacterium sp.]|uniref:hypothetical protein n=1 Tax=Ulvibacterium sp. TaxID=2665914 RepID=UPI0026307F64|nr:hypothetical protein [Ulvibacterium sp.]